MRLRAIAHSRTGDKGDTSNISVIAYDAKDYPLLERHVTAERVKEHFAEIVQGEVVRYALPGLGALNFVMRRALGGGVTRSLALDAHGKCLGLRDPGSGAPRGQHLIELPSAPGSPSSHSDCREAGWLTPSSSQLWPTLFSRFKCTSC